MEVRVREQDDPVVVERVDDRTVLWVRPGLVPTDAICYLGIALENVDVNVIVAPQYQPCSRRRKHQPPHGIERRREQRA